MTARSRSVVPLALLAAVLVIALNTWFAVAAVQSLLKSEDWLAHTWEVIGENEHLLVTLANAESSARSFVITGKSAGLDVFQSALQALPEDIQHVKVLTADNPVQQRNISQARGLIDRRMAILQETVQVRRNSGFEAAQKAAESAAGVGEMDSVRQVLVRIDAEERRLLINRADEARHNGLRAMFAIGLACVLDLTMIGFVTYYFIEERRQRLASEQNADRLAAANQLVERRSEEITTLNLELENRVRERTAELQATNRELEAFSYSVSHDLRAPLRTIDGFSLALEEDYTDAVDAVGRDYISRVRAGVQRMGQLIDALLQLSRITRADVTREPLDLARLAEGVAETLREQNPGREICFTITPGPEATADPKLVQVALENLMGNAVKFTSRQPVAEVSVGWDPTQSAWRISDNGAGFDMHYADKLFNAFNRLHGDKDFKGSGIGLATVARVVRRHGGRIWADSIVDHGATFWFTLG